MTRKFLTFILLMLFALPLSSCEATREDLQDLFNRDAYNAGKKAGSF